MKTIALIIAHQGFQPIEYGEPKKILEAAGHTVVTVSDMPGPATSKFGDTTDVDMTVADLKPAEYDGIFLIGGPGALVHLDSTAVHGIMHAAAASGKPWGAICIAPRILAHAGLLQGKRATGWNDDNEVLEIFSSAGATYVKRPCVEEGSLITADGPESAKLFGEAIARHISVTV